MSADAAPPDAPVASLSLEHFRLRGMEQGRLTGVSLAVHAIPDAFLLMHCGVGCKHKATSQLSTRDWGRGTVEREGWTEVGDAELIAGASDRLGPYLRSWVKRIDPGIVVVISVTFLELTGEDTRSVVAQEADTVACPVVFVDAQGTSGDLHTGYAATLVELARRIDWSPPPSRPRAVGVLGYLFDRYEGDHAGNLDQLRRLVADLGLEPGPILLSGSPWADLQQVRDCGFLVQLPYAAPKRRQLQRVLKRSRPVVEVELPVGLRGSTRFLLALARVVGLAEAPVARKAAARAQSVRTRLGAMAERLRGLRVAVFADLPLLAGTLSVLEELGVEVVLAGIRGPGFGGRDELCAALERLGAPVPPGLTVLVDPSLEAATQAVRARLGSLDGILASATELNAIATLPAEAFLEPDGGPRRATGPFTLELGFPCKQHHAIAVQPWMGFAGVLTWAQRLLDAPRLWDSGLGQR